MDWGAHGRAVLWRPGAYLLVSLGSPGAFLLVLLGRLLGRPWPFLLALPWPIFWRLWRALGPFFWCSWDALGSALGSPLALSFGASLASRNRLVVTIKTYSCDGLGCSRASRLVASLGLSFGVFGEPWGLSFGALGVLLGRLLGRPWPFLLALPWPP